MNADIENTLTIIPCLDVEQMQSKERIIPYEILKNPWEINGSDMLSLYNKHHLCIVDYHSKLPIIKKTESLLAET